MIGTIAFMVVFVGLGLSVVFVAMRGGPKGAREAIHAQTTGGRRTAFTTVGLVIAAFGVAIPAWVMLDNSDSKAQDGPGGVELTAAQAEGRAIFAQNCSTCHTLSATNAVGRVGPNLDQLRSTVADGKSFKALTVDAIEKGRARGQGQMPAGLVDGQEADDVAAFVAAVAGR